MIIVAFETVSRSNDFRELEQQSGIIDPSITSLIHMLTLGTKTTCVINNTFVWAKSVRQDGNCCNASEPCPTSF